MNKKTEEILTGVMVGLILSILLAVKVLAAPVGQTVDGEEVYPAKTQVNEAQEYLDQYQIVIPADVEEACEYYGKKYDICPEILEAVCWVESSCQTDAQDPTKTCKGLMQIKPSVHSDRMNRLNARNVFGIWDNIETGTDYLYELLEGGDDIAVALAKYNGQSDAKIEKAKNGEYSGYVEKVLTISNYLEKVHYK